MGTIQTSTGKGNNTVNTTTVWDRIIKIEDNIGVSNGESIKDQIADMESQLAQIVYIVKPSGGDDTTLINNAITTVSTSSRLKKVVLDGMFVVSASSAFADIIQMKSNVILEFTPGSKITLTPNSFDGYQIISCKAINNFRITNPYIVGDRDGHTGTTGEWGHGIVVWGCQNWNITNVYSEKCWGDGVYIGNNGAVISDNGYIDRIKTYKCGRNGVTFASGKNIQIDYIEGIQIDRTNPKAALDIESNATGEVWENVKIGKVRSYLCPGGVQILPFGMKNNAYVTTVDVTIDQIEVKGNATIDTGSLLIDGVDYTKINGKIKIGMVSVKQADKALYLMNIVNGGLEVEINVLKVISESTSNLATEGAIFVDSSTYSSSKNVGKIYIGELDVSGSGRYLFNIISQQSGTIESSNLRIGKMRNRVTIPSRINGIITKLAEIVLGEVNLKDLTTIYNVGAGWFTYHFLSNHYHNDTATNDSILAPAGASFKLRETPIVIENRVGTYYAGVDLTGKTILPTSLGYVNGFKSSERGAKVTFRQIDDNTFYVMDKVGNWATL